jgi:hypothetical protein
MSGKDFWVEGPWYTNPEWTLTDTGTFRLEQFSYRIPNLSKYFRHEFEYPGYGVYTSLGLYVQLKRFVSNDSHFNIYLKSFTFE